MGEVTPTTFSVYLIPETLRVTVLGGKGEGDYVNIEVENQTQVGQTCAVRSGVAGDVPSSVRGAGRRSSVRW